MRKDNLIKKYQLNKLSIDNDKIFYYAKRRSEVFVHLIKKFFPKNKEALIIELGCGDGLLQHLIKMHGYTNSKGVDISEKQIETAIRNGVNNVFLDDSYKYLLKQNNNSLDLIVCYDVFEHYSKNDLIKIVMLMFRKLKKNGYIISHQPNGESPFGSSSRYDDFTHELSFTRLSISQIFLNHGFSSVICYEDKPIITGIKSFIRYLLWQAIIRNIILLYVYIETGTLVNSAIYSRNLLSIIIK